MPVTELTIISTNFNIKVGGNEVAANHLKNILAKLGLRSINQRMCVMITMFTPHL